MTIAITGFEDNNEDFSAFDDFFSDEFDSFEEEFKNVAEAVIGFNVNDHVKLDGATISVSDESSIFDIILNGKKVGKIGIYVDEED